MRLQALVAGALVTVAVVLLAAGIRVLGGLVALLAVLPVGAFLDSVLIWMRMANPRHWPDLPPIRSGGSHTNHTGAQGPQSPTGTAVRRRVRWSWSWFAPGFMLGWPTWFRARWAEARNFIR